VIFAGAAAVWLFNTLASAVRGTGNMLLPAGVVLGGSPLLVALSPALIFGWGPLPRLGVTGAALAVVAYYMVGALVLVVYLASDRSLVRLSPMVRFERALFREILRVGAPSLVNNVMTNLTVVLLTALVGSFGTFALAGYGMGVRLEYLLIPLVFGFGSALVTMVGTNFGAGQGARRQASGLDRRVDRGRRLGDDRARRGPLPARVARSVQRRARGARGGGRVPPRRRPRLRLLRPRTGTLLRVAGRPGGSCGRCSPALFVSSARRREAG